MEKRLKRRYPLQLSARYRSLSVGSDIAGEGRTVDMSSTSILMTSQHELGAGARVEIVIDWPRRLDARVPLHLVVIGRVVRSDRFTFAVEFAQHQFRIAKSRPKPGPTVFQASASE